MEKDRADKMLVALGLAKTRSKAAQMISRGEVQYKGFPIDKASQIISKDGVSISENEQFVGRGAYKLLKAIEEFSLEFKGKTVADVGASTGGFTQVSLKNGATKVYAIDVGHDQLDPLLREDPRVINLEGTNIREMVPLEEKVDFVVVDLSFVSLATVFESIDSLLKEDGQGVFLVKPQFELDKKSIGKKGVVKDKDKKLEVLKKVSKMIKPLKICISPIKGKEGNAEFLFYYNKVSKLNEYPLEELRKLAEES